MEPLFFGAPDSQLFGVYHPPEGTPRGHGVLLCAPIGHEYVRAHWALRQAAAALARAGLHVLRFDWHGVGDSAGRSSDGSVARWTEDALQAGAELRESSEVGRLTVVGLRVGALLAAAALRRGLRARDLVLWDPVTSGAAWLDGLERMDAVVRTDPRRFGFSLRRELEQQLARVIPLGPPKRVDSELCGFPYPEALRRELRALDLHALLVEPPCERITIVTPGARPELDRIAAAVPLAVEVAGAPGDWQDDSDIEAAYLPGDAVHAIVRVVTR